MELGGLYETVGKGLLVIGAAGAAFTQIARGLSGVATRTSAGVYVMPLAQPVNPLGAVVTAAILQAAAGGGSITVVPDGTGTNWTITTLVGGVAADVNFSVTIEQLAGA